MKQLRGLYAQTFFTFRTALLRLFLVAPMILQQAGTSVPGSHYIQIFMLDFIKVQDFIVQVYTKLTEEPQAI